VKEDTKNGFSLVELVIVMAIVGLLFLTAGPLYPILRRNWELGQARTKVVSALRLARESARSSQNTSNWGVKVGSDLVVFSGSSYAARTTSLDRLDKLPGVTVGGTSEIVFTRVTGATTATQLTLTNGAGTKIITVNNYGLTY
jgi:prepilin-type N-terminal cleavage/methylation domain-containing protein